ncbi:MAG: class I SAM-dependent RNA methyltransferase [Sphaerochaetaceae bacterium]|nr:class I SAM-dependent RNA methyltransferase [Sphaerochaetaceae bacterium]
MSSLCPYFGKCGGCSSLDTPYSEQLESKQKFVSDLLLRVEPSLVFDPIVSGPPLGYRSRARFRYSREGLSFYESKSNTPVILKSCPVLDEQLNAFLSDPPRMNLWELEDGQLSCFSCDKKVLYGSAMGWVNICTETGLSRSLPVSSDVFFQSNLYLLPSLIDYVVSLVSSVTKDGASVMDLYAGVGTFSAFLEDRYRVTAVEINRKCLSLARQHLKKTEFFTSPVERWNAGRRHVDTVIVDPPRVGLDKKVPSMISSWRPENIIYVSCYAQTLARDLERFKENGYRPVKARVFDFYPQTPHVETVCLLTHK